MAVKLLKFGATWCQPCKILDPIIEEVKKERDAIIYEAYDSDKDVDIFTQYRVTSVPTIIITADDQEKERYTGVIPKFKLISLIDKFIA